MRRAIGSAVDEDVVDGDRPVRKIAEDAIAGLSQVRFRVAQASDDDRGAASVYRFIDTPRPASFVAGFEPAAEAIEKFLVAGVVFARAGGSASLAQLFRSLRDADGAEHRCGAAVCSDGNAKDEGRAEAPMKRFHPSRYAREGRRTRMNSAKRASFWGGEGKAV